MGNSLAGRRKRAKIMKITGETFKLRTPATAGDAVRDHPGHVLLDPDAVKRFGVRATPLDPLMGLRPNKTYFLVDLPRFPDAETTTPKSHAPHAPPHRRVRSGINMTAKDRLECLALARRSVSDITVVGRRPEDTGGGGEGPLRVKLRIPRAQMAKLVEESGGDGVEVAEKILDLYVGSSGEAAARGVWGHREGHWKPELDSVKESLRGGCRENHSQSCRKNPTAGTVPLL